MGFGGGAWLRPLSLSPPALWWAGAEAQSQVCEHGEREARRVSDERNGREEKTRNNVSSRRAGSFFSQKRLPV